MTKGKINKRTNKQKINIIIIPFSPHYKQGLILLIFDIGVTILGTLSGRAQIQSCIQKILTGDCMPKAVSLHQKLSICQGDLMIR